ncbi:tRNA (adenosine(37)-N6)-dimethylallyltransferase MiaA [Parapedobacter deserti]|uniref:tRNA dimethylallyltransferase n=1 Tax=Parapedobacter deserti TaxID=1912957 RepID=A0ABV7JGN4_9SPHI
MKKLLVILGPTASGKTRLSVEVAKRINGVIISADSRQVFRGMDVGTGKDLDVYGDVSHRLIDIREAGDVYHVSQYREDFRKALDTICAAGKQPILCGGTGLYIQSVIQDFAYSDVPVNPALRSELAVMSIEALRVRLGQLVLPTGFTADVSTRKRVIRAVEIAHWCEANALPMQTAIPKAVVFGLNPPVEQRRQRITNRLQQRLDAGLVDEVRGLLQKGVPAERLKYYGLEYKFTTQYLLGELDYPTFFARLNTEIHRYAKRQMTYFRKMEKDGIRIQWLKEGPVEEQCTFILASWLR